MENTENQNSTVEFGSKIDTFCGTCVFSEFNKDGCQDGCGANMVDRLTQKGVKVTHISIGNKEEPQIAFVLHDTSCYYWRPFVWLDNKSTDLTDELVKLARDEMNLKADIVIYCNMETSFDQLKVTTDAIQKMSLKPQRIYFVNYNMCRPKAFLAWINENIDMPWRVELLIGDYVDKLSAVDVVTDKCKSRYISIFNAGFAPPADYLAQIDKSLYDNLEKFVMLTPINDIDGLLYMKKLNVTLQGNKYGNIIEQTRILSEDQKCPQMIRKVTEIVPSMIGLESSSTVTITDNV